MDLCPLSYDDMCQMELLQATSSGAGDMLAPSKGATSTAPMATNATTMLPIMVIPTALMPPGSILTLPAGTTLDGGSGAGGNFEHFYQLQPTHILTAAAPVTAAPTAIGLSVGGTGMPDCAASCGAANNGCGEGDGAFSLGTNTSLLAAQPFLLQTPTEQQQQHPQQIPQQLAAAVNVSANAATVNILYGTLTKPTAASTATLTRQALESMSLPRGFEPGSFVLPPSSGNAAEESDFEGSECGASVSASTCIPHFRFGGCGVILQPASMTQQQQQPPQQHQQEPQFVGCGSLTHMMGSFAAAAGGAMHTGRLVGTLAGMGAGLSGTLSRNRRASSATGDGNGNCSTQTSKRASFKGDQQQHLPANEQMQMEGGLCTHMPMDGYADYQTTGFGGLPDVTEHSNIRRTLSRQNSISNSDSGGEISSIQKCKVNFASDTKSSSSGGNGTHTSSSANVKRKSKAAQQVDGNGVQRYKTKRSSCALGLMLVTALALLAIAATLAYQHFLMAPSRNSHAQRLRIVRRILREVPLVDGHNNFAWNVRKYAHSSLELVHLGHGADDRKSIWTRPIWAQTDMERLQQGLVGVQVWSAFVPCEAQGLDAVQLALEQIDIIRRLTDMYPQQTTLVSSSKDIAAARRRGLMASLIGIEGGHAIGSSLGVLRSFYSLGARYLSLTHRCDVSWAGSSSSPLENGLSQFGKAIIREMNRLGMMIDLSYSSDATARDVLQATRAPVIFSHSAARQLCNSTRNIPDDILRLVAENGGLIMISFDSEDVACGRQARLNDVIEHINYIRSIAGVQHIGLGAGYDGIDTPPLGLEDVSKYPDLLATLLEDHNWGEEDVAMLAGKNFLRIMETVENVRDYWKRAAIQPIEQTEPQPKTQCTYMSS